MGILLFILFGFIVGLIARALMPGDQRMGFLMTSGLGIAGSFLGGFLVSLATSQRVAEVHTSGLIGSVFGAFLILYIASGLYGRRAIV